MSAHPTNLRHQLAFFNPSRALRNLLQLFLLPIKPLFTALCLLPLFSFQHAFCAEHSKILSTNTLAETVIIITQTILSLVLTLKIVRYITLNKKSELALIVHLLAINIFIFQYTGNVLGTPPPLINPEHWLLLTTTAVLITTLYCYQQQAWFSHYASRLQKPSIFLGSVSLIASTAIILYPAFSKELITLSLLTLITHTLLTLGAFVYLSTKNIRLAKYATICLLIATSTLIDSWLIEPGPRSIPSLAECLVLAMQTCFIIMVQRLSFSLPTTHSFNSGTIKNTNGRRRVFEEALRKHLQKPESPLKADNLPQRIITTIEAVLTDIPAAVAVHKAAKWQLTVTRNTSYDFFESALHHFETQVIETLNTVNDCQINLAGNKEVSYWLFPLEVERNTKIVLILVSLETDKSDKRWHTACDIASHSRTLYQACKQSQYWEEQANLDPLTGLLNRRAFNQEARRYLKHNKQCGSLLFIDIDNFKQINDAYGHHKGDKLLIKVAKICQKSLRQTDLLCRYGGDEFIALLPETAPSQALKVAERIRSAITATQSNINDLNISISIGISAFSGQATKLKHLVSEADKALYQAKKQGKNQIALSAPYRDIELQP